MRFIPQLLAIGFIAIAIQSAFAWLDGPSLGITISGTDNETHVVQSVHPGSIGWFAGITPGDIVTSVDRLPVADGSVSGWVRGERVEAISPNGQPLSGELESKGASGVATFIGLTVTALAFAVVGILIGARRVQTRRTITVSTMLLLIAIALVLGPAATLQRPLEQAMEANVIPWAIASLLWTVHVGVGRSGDAVKRFSYCVSVTATALAFAFNVGWCISYWVTPDLYTTVRSAFFLILTMLLLIAAGEIAVAWLKGRDPQLRKILRTLSLGFAVAVLPAVLFSYIPYLISREFLLRPEATTVSMVLIPVTIGLTANREQALGIGSLANPRGLRLIATMCAFALLTLIAIGAIDLLDVGAVEMTILIMLTTFMAIPIGLIAEPAINTALARVLKTGKNFNSLFQQITDTANMAPDIDCLIRDSAACIQDYFGAEVVTIKQLAAFNKHSIDALRDREILSSIPIAENSMGSSWAIVVGSKLNGDHYRDVDQSRLNSLALALSSGLTRLSTILQLRQLNQKLVQVDEQARSFAASEIHDDSLQLAQFIASKVSSSSDLELLTAARSLAENLRELSARLSSSQIHHLGFIEALADLASQFSLRHSIVTEISIDPTVENLALPPQLQLSVYRIVQESLTNIAKHSNASACWVSMTLSSDCLTIEVADNGVGLRSDNRSGLGLWGMRGRVEIFNGTMTLTNRSSKGAVLRVSIPIEEYPLMEAGSVN